MKTDREAEGTAEIAAAYDAYANRVYGYALRSCRPVDADDVVSDVFAIAWRRREDLPDEPLSCLLATARNVISERRRADRRRSGLVDQWSQHASFAVEEADGDVVRRHLMLAALGRLSEKEREALLLVAWDGLTTDDAARVVRCTPRAFRARVTRARARLTASLSDSLSDALPDPDQPGAGHAASAATERTPR